MKNFCIICVSVLLTTTVFTQKIGKQGADLDNFIASATEKQLVKENTDQMLNGFFANADKIADKLLSFNVDNANYNYRKGYALFMLNKNPEQVISYLSKATKKTKKVIDAYSTKDVASVNVYYYLGASYLKLEKLDSAQYFYQSFNENTDKKSVLYKYSEAGVKQCENAKKQIENKNEAISVVNLGPLVNTEYPEYSSVLSLDGFNMFFTSRRPWGGDTSHRFISQEEGLFPEDIYQSEKNGGVWSSPKRLAKSSPMYNEAVITLHRGQNTLYTYTDSTGRGDIYFSDAAKEDILTNANLLDIPGINDKKSWETSIFFSKDGKKLYFSSDRKGGYGGRDLYYCEKNSDGSWSEPKNMGPAVNTAYDEESPAISDNGKYFFYSSNNEKSMGGFDIFYAPIAANGSIGNGEPLDYPLNSTEDDIFYSNTTNGYKGYFTSSRMGSFGGNDIYEIDLNYIGLDKAIFAVVDFKMPDESSPIPDNTRIRFVCNECTEKSIETVADRESRVIQALEPCQEYYLEYISTIDGQELVFKTDTVQTDCDLAKQEIKKSIVIEKEKVEEIAVPDEAPISDYKQDYAYNKNTISVKEKEYKEMIKTVRTTLKEDENAMIVFEIYSSASSVPTKKYGTNEKLAQLRANNAMAELIKEFSGDMEMFSRIKIEVKEAKVDGPAYDNDARNMDKYAPFQFVEVKAFQK